MPYMCRGNLEVLDWQLSVEDYAKLSTLPDQQRMVNGAMWLVRKAAGVQGRVGQGGAGWWKKQAQGWAG